MEVDEAETGTTDTPEGADDIDTSSRVALNGMTASTSNLLVSTDTSQLRTLAQGSLATAGSRVPSLFATAEGREQFAYLYSCAASTGTLSVSANGKSYMFRGTMGLANEWMNAPLPAAKYKLITACMLARTNYYGVQVSISMRSAKVTVKASELSDYTVPEGAFWGDAFTAGGKLRACASPEKRSGQAISTLPQRECAASIDGVTTMCGFGYAGPCEDVCVTDLTKRFGYSTCEGNADTIAVYVAKP